MNKLLITKTTSLEEIRQNIAKLREQKGKETETLKLINESKSLGHDFVANLFFEEALTYQHIYMNDSSNKEAMLNMEKSILEASIYINKYKINKLSSRLFRFMGRVSDYKGQYKKAIGYYKKAIKFVELDPEPFRILELEAFLSYSMIMSGDYTKGVKYAKKIYSKFINSSEGIKLMKKDYNTWAIWMSGVTYRTVIALIDRKIHFDRNEIENWIRDTNKYLKGKDNFSYRRSEIESLWTKIKN